MFIVPSSNLFSKQMMCHARSAWWLETKSYARIVPPPPRFTRQPQKEKMFLAFRICARPIFSKMERTFFFLGFCPPSIRAVRGASMRTRFCETIFWERIRKTETELFLKFGGDSEFSPHGGRVWEGIRAGFWIFGGESRRILFFLQVFWSMKVFLIVLIALR